MALQLGGGVFNPGDGQEGFGGNAIGESAPMGGTMPGGGNTGVGSVLGGPNPFQPKFPTGSSAMPITMPPPTWMTMPVPGATYGGAEQKGGIGTGGPAPVVAGGGSFPANGTGTSAGVPGFPSVGGFGGPGNPGSLGNIPGMSSQATQLLYQFLSSGAGFNPQVMSAMIAALQPQIERGQENVIEQFGSMGLGNSSAAAIGLGDFNSQVTLDEGQLFSQMYEQATQNYLQALGLTKTQPLPSGLGSLLGGIGSLGGALLGSGGLGALGKLLGIGGGSGGGGSTTAPVGGGGGIPNTDPSGGPWGGDGGGGSPIDFFNLF